MTSELPGLDTFPAGDAFPSSAEFPAGLDDIEALLVTWLAGQFPDAIVCTETDADLEQQPETIRVARAGGPSTFTLDRPRIVLDSFAGGTGPGRRQAARTLAGLVNHAMQWLLRGQVLGAVVVVTKVDVVSGPSWVPDPNTSLRHFVGTYAPTVRRIV